MILSEESALRVGTSNNGVSFTESDRFSCHPRKVIDSSTPRKRRSVSYLELTSPYNETSVLSDSSLQRMRCLSQSISDLKILRERQQERRHDMGEVLNDDFIQEHARKLKDARNRIKELEAKYQSHNRARTKFDVTRVDKKRRELVSGLDARTDTAVNPARRKPRPLTWATEDDFSDCNSLSSFGSNKQRMMEIIPENLDRNRTHCCYGYEGEQGKLDYDCTEFDHRHYGTTTAYHLPPRQHPTSNPATTTKWRSMPNLSTNETPFLENRTMMYGEAIPIDPTQTAKKHNTKFTRKSGFYKVNESPEKNSPNSTKKRKFREKLFGRKSTSKKNSQKLVSSPKEGLTLGKALRCHPSIDTAYIIELNRPDKGAFGFHIQKGHEQNKNGIFVSKIVDKKSAKFLSGLLHVGDKILEINSMKVKAESLASVQKLIKNADKLELSILPSSSCIKEG